VELQKFLETFLTIATTRPETIPGDTAVAVNPKDPRYAKYIASMSSVHCRPNFRASRSLFPSSATTMWISEFGTGILKVTPAHDKADFEIGLRHN